MNTKNAISSRFIEVYERLLQDGKISDKKDFANKIDISPSLVTEISKGRSAVGVTPLQNIVLVFGVSAQWLLTGTGPMLLSSPESAVSSSPSVSSKESLTHSGRASSGNATASGTHSIAAINSAVNASPPSPDASLRRENELLRSLIDEKERLISVLMERK